MTTPEPEFLTFEELVRRWGYSKTYLHDLIRTGQIIPAIALSDQDRYPSGEFRGGSFIGDVDTAKHKSYVEYYVGKVIGQENHPENWPKCARIVFCHAPSDEGDNDYSFHFFTESLDLENTEVWYYFDKRIQITGKNGEDRFRFLQSEIKWFEDAAHNVKEPVQDKGKSIIHRTTQGRKHVLATEIKTARKRAEDPDNVHSVWTELAKMAEAKEGCLRGIGDDEIKYGHGMEEDFKFFKKKNLRDRMRSAKTH